MSPSKLHNVFKNHHKIDPNTLCQFSQYLEVDVEHVEAMNALKLPLVGNDDGLPSESHININEETISNASNSSVYRVFLLLGAVLLSGLFIYFVNQSQAVDIKVIDYQASGEDLAPQELGEEEFNPALYSYLIANAKMTKNNGTLTLNADLSVVDRESQEIVITGEMLGSGYYFGDQGSIAYKVENSSNGDSWAGVFMLDMPSTGSLKGYWLTSHNDTNSKYGFRYSIGSVLGTRCDKSQNRPCIAPKLKGEATE